MLAQDANLGAISILAASHSHCRWRSSRSSPDRPRRCRRRAYLLRLGYQSKCSTPARPGAPSGAGITALKPLCFRLATNLARAGVAPQIAQRIMRHSDYRTTLKHYTVLGLRDTAAAI